MRAALFLAFALAFASAAGAANTDPTEAWRPMFSFIGSWKGTRAGVAGPVKVTRVYASSPTNHHLEITEKGAGPAAVWGMVSFDAQREVLVLRHFAPDGTTSDATFDAARSTPDQLVFAGPDARITYERAGWKSFVERVEVSGALVSETRFVRKD